MAHGLQQQLTGKWPQATPHFEDSKLKKVAMVPKGSIEPIEHLSKDTVPLPVSHSRHSRNHRQRHSTSAASSQFRSETGEERALSSILY